MVINLTHILDKISLFHLNILLLLGLALFGGMVGGRIFQKLKIPQVVGYIIIGVIIGDTGLKIVSDSMVETLKPFNYFALGLIGFIVGGELKRENFLKYGKNFIHILLWEGITPFLLVTLSVGLAGSLMFGPKPFVWALSLLLGAIASATDPASTTSVLKEYKTRGPLTVNTVGIVALDDGLALILFAIASSVAVVLLGNSDSGMLKSVIHSLYEIIGAVIIGAVSGIGLTEIITKYNEKERILAFSIGTVLLVTGLSLAIGVSMLLSVMTLGVILVNLRPHKSKEAFTLVEGFTPPIYVLFFVLVGAKLKFSNITLPILILVIVYLFFGLAGKTAGAYIGAKLSKAPKTVTKYLPFALYSQAGIAIGLSILAAQYFPGDFGTTLVVIITATTFITQIIGPSFTKYAVTKAGEVGLDITEEDIIQKSTASDVMDKNPPVIYDNMPLRNIMQIFSENDNLSYPVVNKNRVLRGIITIEGIRQTFLEMDLGGGLVLAHDLMERIRAKISQDASLVQVKQLLDRYDTECLPVVDSEGRLNGFIERKKLSKFIATKMIELQEQISSLG